MLCCSSWISVWILLWLQWPHFWNALVNSCLLIKGALWSFLVNKQKLCLHQCFSIKTHHDYPRGLINILKKKKYLIDPCGGNWSSAFDPSYTPTWGAVSSCSATPPPRGPSPVLLPAPWSSSRSINPNIHVIDGGRKLDWATELPNECIFLLIKHL